MRRHTLYIFLLLIVAVNNILPVQAQLSKQYALYNYRNDGDFNAWLNIDVDSITYSCFDLDSIEHDDVVVQEVWTPDSVYRIPLEVIDSIGFRAPEPKFKDNVFHITEKHLPYVLDVGELFVEFSIALPWDLRPNVGQVIISDTFDEPFENGFMGIVTDVKIDGNKLVVVCGEARINDVFDELVLVGKVVSVANDEIPQTAKKHIRDPRRLQKSGGIEEIDIPGKFELKLLDFLKIKDEVKLSCDYSLYIHGFNLNARAVAHADHDMKTEFTIDTNTIAEWMSGQELENEPDWLVPIPLLNILGVFDLDLTFGVFIDPEVKLEFKGTQPMTLHQSLGFEAKWPVDDVLDLPIKLIVNSKATLGDPELSLSLEGKLFAGIAARLRAMIIGDKVLSGNVTGRFGPEISANFSAKISTATPIEDVNAYTILKDSKISAGLKADAKAKFKIFKNVWPPDDDNTKIPLTWKWDWEIPGWQARFFVPEFTQPELPPYSMPNALSMSTRPSRDLISKKSQWHVGIAVFDKDGKKVVENYNKDVYQYEIDNKENPSVDISQLPAGETFTCLPMLSNMKAAPSITFTVPNPVSLSVSSLVMNVENTRDVRIKDGWGDFKVINMNPNIVSAEVIKHQLDDGTKISDVHVVCKAVGTAFIKVVDLRSKAETTLKVTVTNEVIPDDGIDLGLPSGTKWASYNIGATKPEEYGGYYSWGETEVRDQYYFTTYSLCDGTVSSCHDIGENISGTEYDVAHVKWGGDWCMPTKDDFQELVYTCEYKETTRNGVKGYQFTGPNGQYIFLPYTGYYWNTENSNVGSEGCYWSATQTTSVSKAHEMSFKKDEVLWDCYINRFAGLSVRPVMHSTPSLADLTLSTTDPITVTVDDKATVEITSGNGSYTAESDNEDVAIARVYDNASVIIKGVSVGTATITVTDTKSGQTATVAVTVTGTFNPDVSSGEAIDLGLPSGTKWASCNVGATKPEEYGGYYAWGETEEKEVYNWSTYIHCDGSSSTCHDLGSDISGTEYDVAHVKWGGNWCMPTKDDIQELLDNCTREWTTLNGVNGRKFISKINGNSIFLPAAGVRWGGGLRDAGGDGYYWSSTQDPDYSYIACCLYFYSGGAYWESDSRDNGQSVRPVARN